MFNLIQHLFTVRAIERELRDVRLENESLKGQVAQLERKKTSLPNKVEKNEKINAVKRKKLEAACDAAPAVDQHSRQHDGADQPNKVFHSILALIATYHSQNIEATPARLAADMSLDPEVTLAYMWKYHNEQFITFANGGKKPDLNTAFFLSQKAWQHIKVVRT